MDITVHYPETETDISDIASEYAKLIQKYFSKDEAEKLGIKNAPAYME